MSLGYAIAYRIGLRPWEDAADGGRAQVDRLFDRVTQDAGTPGRAIDLGCGRGLHMVSLARRGWEVTGVDQIGRALDGARERLQENKVQANLVAGDVTALPASAGSGFDLVLDVGCFHGLGPADRAAYGREVTRVTNPKAQLLMLAFAPGGRGPLPRGAGAQDITAALPGWSLTDREPAETTGLRGPAKTRAPQFYLLTKN